MWGLGLSLQQSGELSVRLSTAPLPRKSKSYLALDIRSWDESGSPIINTLYVWPDGRAKAASVGARHPPWRTDLVSLPDLGTVKADRLKLAPYADGEGFLLTCWGSVADRLVDPLAVTWVEVRRDQ